MDAIMEIYVAHGQPPILYITATASLSTLLVGSFTHQPVASKL